MQRYAVYVLQHEDTELYDRLTTGMPQGQYAWGQVHNTRGLRDALNKAP